MDSQSSNSFPSHYFARIEYWRWLIEEGVVTDADYSRELEEALLEFALQWYNLDSMATVLVSLPLSIDHKFAALLDQSRKFITKWRIEKPIKVWVSEQ